MKKTTLLFALLVSASQFAQQSNFSSTNSLNNNETASIDDANNISEGLTPNDSILKKEISTIDFNPKSKSVLETQKSDSPYEWKWVRDGIWTGAALGASAYGLLLIKDKDDLPVAERESFFK